MNFIKKNDFIQLEKNIELNFFKPKFSFQMLLNYLFKGTLTRYFSDDHLKSILPKLKGEVLEIGSTPHRNYYKRWSKNVEKFIKSNISPYSNRILKLDATQIDMPDNSKDGVICLSVLEHINDYQKAINEFYRILKKDGKLIIATPFLFCVHAAPSDYNRLTHFAYAELLKDFSDVKITFIGNKYFAIAHFLQGIEWIKGRVKQNNILIRLLGVIFYILGHLQNNIDNYPLIYNIEATK